MAGEKGELAKTIMLPYLQRADELQKHDPLVAYYCRLYAMERGMKVPSKERSKTMNALLISLMNQLEKDKKTVKLNPDDYLHVEGFALNVFSKADKQDRAGRADLNTAKTFYAASIFFEILNQFGELQPEVEQKQKYAVWKAADIRKALSEGRTPEPGPPGGDSGFSLDDVLTEDELLQERGNSAPAPQNTSPPSFQDHQQNNSPPSFQDHQQNSYSPPSFQEHGTTGSFTSRIDHLRAAPDGAASRPDDMDYQQQPEQRAHHSKFSGDQHFQPEYRAHHPDFSSFPPPTEQHFQATNSDRWGGEANEDYGSVAAAPFASATYPQAASSAYYPTPSSFPPAGDYHTPPSDQHAPPSYPCFNNAPGSLQPPPQQQHQFPSAPIYEQDQAQIPRTSSAPPAAKQESDSSYSPTPDKVSEAHRASRFAVSALAFDDVPTAISYLRRALELLTSPSAS